jgi:hypothetical protein
MTSLGPIELVIVLLILAVVALPVWAIVDAIIRPDSAWAAADQNKTLWVVMLIVGTFALGPVGLVLAIVYLASIRPKMRPTG